MATQENIDNSNVPEDEQEILDEEAENSPRPSVGKTLTDFDVDSFLGDRKFQNPNDRSALSYLFEGLANAGMVGDEFRRGLKGTQDSIEFRNKQLKDMINILPEEDQKLLAFSQAGYYDKDPKTNEAARKLARQMRDKRVLKEQQEETKLKQDSEHRKVQIAHKKAQIAKLNKEAGQVGKKSKGGSGNNVNFPSMQSKNFINDVFKMTNQFNKIEDPEEKDAYIQQNAGFFKHGVNKFIKNEGFEKRKFGKKQVDVPTRINVDVGVMDGLPLSYKQFMNNSILNHNKKAGQYSERSSNVFNRAILENPADFEIFNSVLGNLRGTLKDMGFRPKVEENLDPNIDPFGSARPRNKDRKFSVFLHKTGASDVADPLHGAGGLTPQQTEGALAAAASSSYLKKKKDQYGRQIELLKMFKNRSKHNTKDSQHFLKMLKDYDAQYYLPLKNFKDNFSNIKIRPIMDENREEPIFIADLFKQHFSEEGDLTTELMSDPNISLVTLNNMMGSGDTDTKSDVEQSIQKQIQSAQKLYAKYDKLSGDTEKYISDIYGYESKPDTHDRKALQRDYKISKKQKVLKKRAASEWKQSRSIPDEKAYDLAKAFYKKNHTVKDTKNFKEIISRLSEQEIKVLDKHFRTLRNSKNESNKELINSEMLQAFIKRKKSLSSARMPKVRSQF